MKTVTIELSRDEFELAWSVAGRRQAESVVRKHSGRNGCPNMKYGMQNAITGALAELAVAKWLGKFWDMRPNIFRDKPDVGDYEVRSTTNDKYGLTLRDADREKGPNRIYIFVQVRTELVVEIIGWMYGGYVFRDEYKTAPDPSRPPCYMMPRELLYDLQQLPGKEPEKVGEFEFF